MLWPWTSHTLKQNKETGFLRASQVVLEVKNLPANSGDVIGAVQSLGGEDPLEEGMAANSRILAWRIPWTEEPGRLQTVGSQRESQN